MQLGERKKICLLSRRLCIPLLAFTKKHFFSTSNTFKELIVSHLDKRLTAQQDAYIFLYNALFLFRKFVFVKIVCCWYPLSYNVILLFNSIRGNFIVPVPLRAKITTCV